MFDLQSELVPAKAFDSPVSVETINPESSPSKTNYVVKPTTTDKQEGDREENSLDPTKTIITVENETMLKENATRSCSILPESALDDPKAKN